ncbi:transposase, IS982 family [Bathymodiolus platifrons methanotrophic gill symbiont]|uniref:IS982 family transposase n=1 Tax=Bathymodiolus platifrons methanotrophic gill symbiont TaxID=113268 RepID=UPI001B46EE10|nr:IS982 family transposase [Bathymodiolus platifrons methanotrophic gill symbiont]GFO74559.1 transposase, IS982 family [Bathymodiolus platifrons methanotrophic gill symbiont]
MSLTQLFCDVDDFCKVFIPEWEKTQIDSGEKKRRRKRCISTSEIISLIIYYHQSGYGTFKWFYLRYLPRNLSGAFPKAPSYNRFIELLPEVIVPLTAFMQTRCGKGEGIAFVDSTPLRVCKNLRIPRHKTFKEVAQRGKSSTGWFYGFKLHIIVDDRGEILSFSITKGNVDDRKPVPYLAKKVIGKLFGDRGYISKKLTELLATDDVELITTLRKNMKPRVMTAFDAILLRKRSIIETINDQLKNIFQLEHSRHRSLTNYMVNAVACLVAYSYQEKKPALNLRRGVRLKVR